MSRPLAGSLVFALAGFMLFVPAPALAQDGGWQGGGPGGPGDNGPPHQGGSGEEDWNPTVHCDVLPGDDIYDLLQCFMDRINHVNPTCSPHPPLGSVTGPGGTVMLPGEPAPTCFDPGHRTDWILTMFDYGINMERWDHAPMKRISFREQDSGLQYTRVYINGTPKLVARIRKIDEDPVPDSGPDDPGTIDLTIDGFTVSLSTTRYQTMAALNANLVDILLIKGFMVYEEDAYLYVMHGGNGCPYGVNSVEFRSTDTDIINSDLSLYQFGEFDAIPSGFAPVFCLEEDPEGPSEPPGGGEPQIEL